MQLSRHRSVSSANFSTHAHVRLSYVSYTIRLCMRSFRAARIARSLRSRPVSHPLPMCSMLSYAAPLWWLLRLSSPSQTSARAAPSQRTKRARCSTRAFQDLRRPHVAAGQLDSAPYSAHGRRGVRRHPTAWQPNLRVGLSSATWRGSRPHLAPCHGADVLLDLWQIAYNHTSSTQSARSA